MSFWTDSEADETISAAPVTRRKALATAVTGIAAALVLPARASTAAWSSSKSSNAHIVNDFCNAWAIHDFDRLMSFLAANIAYRIDETHEPIKGKQAVAAEIKKLLSGVKEFKVLDTLAKGPWSSRNESIPSPVARSNPGMESACSSSRKERLSSGPTTPSP
jgi:hypothetical protein